MRELLRWLFNLNSKELDQATEALSKDNDGSWFSLFVVHQVIESRVGVLKHACWVRLSFRKSVTLVVEGKQMVSCKGKFDDGKKVMADVVGVSVKKENGPSCRKGS